MKTSNQLSRGLTLVETVVVIAFTISMMVAIGLLVFMFNKTVSFNRAMSQSSGSASAVVREISSLTLQASNVLASHTFTSGGLSASSANLLVLEIPSIDNAGVVIPNTYDYAKFYVTGTSLYRTLETSPGSVRQSGTKLLSTTVSSLSFTYNSADFAAVDTVTIDIQTQAQVKQDVLSDHRREMLVLRNF